MSGKDAKDFVLRIVGCPNFLEFSHSLVDYAWIRTQVCVCVCVCVCVMDRGKVGRVEREKGVD